jgi:hypothetical protein
VQLCGGEPAGLAPSPHTRARIFLSCVQQRNLGIRPVLRLTITELALSVFIFIKMVICYVIFWNLHLHLILIYTNCILYPSCPHGPLILTTVYYSTLNVPCSFSHGLAFALLIGVAEKLLCTCWLYRCKEVCLGTYLGTEYSGSWVLTFKSSS